MTRIGIVREITRYPVKSMAGVSVDSAALGWHGLAGDRRFAFRRISDRSGFPWLSATRLPELILYQPVGNDETSGEPLPTHVRTPGGSDLELMSPALRNEVASRLGEDVEMINFRNGIFDDANISVISNVTVDSICHEAGVPPDVRRFRANVVLDVDEPIAFVEDVWVGGSLHFGGTHGVEVAVTARDVRCMMINLRPESAKQDSSVLRSVVRRNNNLAGVYGTVVRMGEVYLGQEVFFEPRG